MGPAMLMSPDMKRMGDFVRGFARAAPLTAAELAALYFVLALEQAERASVGAVLTVDLWLKAAAVAWQWRKGS